MDRIRTVKLIPVGCRMEEAIEKPAALYKINARRFFDCSHANYGRKVKRANPEQGRNMVRRDGFLVAVKFILNLIDEY